MPNAKARPHFGCPKCKSEYIVEVNTVFAEWQITTWNEQGEPEDFGSTEVFYETCEPCSIEKHGVARYRCSECSNEFDTPVRLDCGHCGELVTEGHEQTGRLYHPDCPTPA
jgi:transposase-like protein